MYKVGSAALAGLVAGAVVTHFVHREISVSDSAQRIESVSGEAQCREFSIRGADDVIGGDSAPAIVDATNDAVRISNDESASGQSKRSTTDFDSQRSQNADLENILRSESLAESSLPDQYLPLLKVRPQRRSMNIRETHNFFEADSRDEQWAYAMETGIGEYLASNLSDDAILVEHIECRSRLCRVGGILYPDTPANIGEHFLAMSETGWWQLDGARSSVFSKGTDGVHRFITFIPRDNEVMTVPPDFDDQCE